MRESIIDTDLVAWLQQAAKDLPSEVKFLPRTSEVSGEWVRIFAEPLETEDTDYTDIQHFDTVYIGSENAVLGRVVCRHEYVETDDYDEEDDTIPYEFATFVHKIDVLLDSTDETSKLLRTFLMLRAVIADIHKDSVSYAYYNSAYMIAPVKDKDLLSVCAALGASDPLSDPNVYYTIFDIMEPSVVNVLEFTAPKGKGSRSDALTFDYLSDSKCQNIKCFNASHDFEAEIEVLHGYAKVYMTSKVLDLKSTLPEYVESVRLHIENKFGSIPIHWLIHEPYYVDHMTRFKRPDTLGEYGFSRRNIFLEFSPF